ncbi:hypothetical protein Glove_167g36 [Diversispora epigaea]|uniref:Uncharacterized protein n=1 Tax=Diversispora epigaea TaxID=1348612 RepID=A0A397IQ89_9GLOM|nr:hypothetical protein Glove_167g36 [Diversispora epigaea]
MASLSGRRGTNCTDTEWDEYVKMPQILKGETPSEWMKRIWERLTYFRKNDLLLTQSKKYLEARKLIELWNKYRGNYDSYAPEIGIAICFSCDRLVYTGEQTKNIGNYNHIGMERHWASHCTGNTFCGVNYDEYLKIKQKSNSMYNFDNEYALHRYRLWMQNAIKKVERAREVGKKIRAYTIIQRKFIEWYYRPSGLCAIQLAEHYKLLWKIREEMHKINNFLDSICIMKFNKAYSDLINKLPPSLVNEAWKRLISRKKSPMTAGEASAVNPLVESFLRHEVNRYQKKLKYQRKSLPLFKNFLYDTNMPNQETQTQDTNPICDHEKKINYRVKKELDSLSLQLLEFNEKTFDPFIQEITKQIEERVNANNKLRSENNQQKLKLQKAEKLLARLPLFL